MALATASIPIASSSLSKSCKTGKSDNCHCRFQFGSFFRKDSPPSQVRAASYHTVWLGTRSKAYGYGFNPYWHGRMLERVKAQNSTAVYYSYLIAMLARYTKGIKDCDVGSPSLCVHGADFVREHEGLILRTYDAYANQTAKVLGRSAPVVWLMEPDWHQYNEATQRGGGLTQSRMVKLFVAMVGRIKRHLPMSLISLDVSPWVSEVGEWMGAHITYTDEHAPACIFAATLAHTPLLSLSSHTQLPFSSTAPSITSTQAAAAQPPIRTAYEPKRRATY